MGFFSELKYMITDTYAYTKLEMLAWDVQDKVKDSVAYAKEHPVKTAAKAASVAATIYSAGTAVTSIKSLGTVVKDVSDSYICGKTASAGEDLSKLWAKLALQDSTNKKIMKKAATDVAKTAVTAKAANEINKR